MMTCSNWFLELWQTFGQAAGWIALGLWLYQWFNGKRGATHGLEGASSLPDNISITPSTALVVAVLTLLAVGIAAFASLES